jgi:hypothetical protein
LLYFVAGGLVGLLVLGEFALAKLLPALNIALLVLAVVSLGGALRGRRAVSAWSVFLLAAMVVPLMIDSRIVGLPRCADVAPGVACVASARDYQSPFWFELAIFATALVGSALHLAAATRIRPTLRS